MKARALKETNWGVFLVMAAALFLILNYLSFRHYHRWDATASQTFTLSPQTAKVVKDLKAPLKVVVFLAPNDELFGKVKDLLSAYQAASSKVSVEYIDPDRQTARMQELAKQYRVSVANVVVFDTGEHSKYVEKDQMVDYDFSAMRMGGAPKIKAFKAEEAFTNAILDLQTSKKAIVYFTSGHGERDGGSGGTAVGTFRDRLTKEGIQVHEWQSLGKSSVPQDADALIIAGPEQPFLPQEAEAVGRYLEGGGKVLMLLDPILEVGSGQSRTFGKTGLEALLGKWGITLGEDIAIDPSGAVPYVGAQTFFAAAYSDHPIVRDLGRSKLPVLFTLAQSLETDKPADSDFRCENLIQSTRKAWGERDLKELEKVSQGPGDQQGPLTLAAAVSSEKDGKDARLVVVGDSDVLSDSLLQAGGGNLLLGLNAIHWLLSQESQLAIPPKTAVDTHLSLTAGQMNFLFILFVIILPGLVVVSGVLAYLKRRR
jgi:ABC-type uncharacterized transport system involved in gliding motility auxiliary subunit